MLRRTQLAAMAVPAQRVNLAGERMNPLYYPADILFHDVDRVGAPYLACFSRSASTVAPRSNISRGSSGIWRRCAACIATPRTRWCRRWRRTWRHFAFDRYRSFRWFSGIGVVLPGWYASGINGYMLPWDGFARTRDRHCRVVRLAADVQGRRAISFLKAASTTACSRCCRSSTRSCRCVLAPL